MTLDKDDKPFIITDGVVNVLPKLEVKMHILKNAVDFANKIADVFNLKKSLIKPILTSELNQTAKRPLKSGLKSDYAQNILNLEPPTIKDCLETIVEQK